MEGDVGERRQLKVMLNVCTIGWSSREEKKDGDNEAKGKRRQEKQTFKVFFFTASSCEILSKAPSQM